VREACTSDSNPAAIVGRRRREFFALHVGVSRVVKGRGPQLRQAVCAERIIFFHFRRRSRSGFEFPLPTFVPGRGIFPRSRPHLTNLGAVARIAGVGARSFPSVYRTATVRMTPTASETVGTQTAPRLGWGPLDLSIHQMFK